MTDAFEGRTDLRRGDENYPTRLMDLPAPPPVLHVRGDLNALKGPALAIIGSRRASPYGIAVAELAGRLAAESGITVVSGGARGCDQAAGAAALRAGGRHVIVLGTGADVVYPPSAKPLVDRTLAVGGCLVSLEPWGARPHRWAFPKRNRIIAALTSATFVAEAGMPSGTFSTAETADDLGREVLAAPGSIFSPESRGSNFLIANGACCVSDEEALETAISRIFGTLRFCRPPVDNTGGVDGRSRRVLDMLVANPMRPDDIAASMGLDGPACLVLLSGLEVGGMVVRMADGRISPSKSALQLYTRLGHNT